jgi:hypothetical protein
VKEVSTSRRIGVGQPQVWAALSAFGGISSWAPNVDHSTLLRESVELPDRTGLVRRIQVGRRTVLERVVRWESDTTLAYEIEGLPKVVRSARNEWSLRGDGPTTTLVTLTSHVDCGPRPPQRAVAGLVARRLARESEQLLAGLARSLEDPRG